MANNNCLSGMRCPQCKSEEPFKIAITTIMEVYDNGTESCEDVEWEENAYCRCMECQRAGKVKDFTIANQELKKLKRTKDKNLPKFIGLFESDEAKQELERRLGHGQVQPSTQRSSNSPQAPLS